MTASSHIMLLMLAAVLLVAPVPPTDASPGHGLQSDNGPFPVAAHRVLSEEQPSVINATTSPATNATLDAIIANHSQAIKACSANASAYRPFNATTIATLSPEPAKTQWPELACQPAAVAKAVIHKERPDLTVIVISSDAATILNYDEYRVFLRMDKKELVDPQFTPTIG